MSPSTITSGSDKRWWPQHCTWELTLECDLRCRHCGSRAGQARPRELDTAECLDVAAQLADMGTELVTLSGGEPTRRADWDEIARALVKRGVLTNMVTNGVYREGLPAHDVARRALDAGLCNVGISIDGPEPIHEAMRGRDTFRRTLAAIDAFNSVGMQVSVMTTVNRLNLPVLPETRQIAIDAGAATWRLQLAHPMGTMERHQDLVIRPRQLLDLLPMLVRLKNQGGIKLIISDSIGYHGPQDTELRNRTVGGRPVRWMGCQAGLRVVGIQADGGVKGCLSLQARWGDDDPFLEGNLREARLSEIWNRPGAFAFNRQQTTEGLTGACGDCRHAKACRGGAKCMAAAVGHVLTENPYCYQVVNDADTRRVRRAAVGAAAAAAMLALGGCGCSGPKTPPSSYDEPQNEPVTAPEYAAPAYDPDLVAEYAVQQPEPDVTDEYGVRPEPEPDVRAEYAVEL